jgi:hypothetical protein
MNAAFSCGSASFVYKLDAKGVNALQNANRGGGNTGVAMRKSLLLASVFLATATATMAASAVNNDNETRTLIVTEGGNKTELALAGGETVEFCPTGCFVTLPNGDLTPLNGSETVVISGGVAHIK